MKMNTYKTFSFQKNLSKRVKLFKPVVTILSLISRLTDRSGFGRPESYMDR